MPAPRELRLLRDWVRRAISGYWTHAGYLNWDTGLGYQRWHQRKKVGLAQGALIGVAPRPSCSRPALGRVGEVAARPRARPRTSR